MKPSEPTPMEANKLLLQNTFKTECPLYDHAWHKLEVESGDTRLWDYWEWVVHQIEAEGRSVEGFIADARKNVFVSFEWVYPDEDGGSVKASINAVTGVISLLEPIPENVNSSMVRHRVWFNPDACFSAPDAVDSAYDGDDFAAKFDGAVWKIAQDDLELILDDVPDVEVSGGALQALCEDTNTQESDWEIIDGPETGVGIERWFRHSDGREAYTVDDQGDFTIEVTEAESPQAKQVG